MKKQNQQKILITQLPEKGGRVGWQRERETEFLNRGERTVGRERKRREYIFKSL